MSLIFCDGFDDGLTNTKWNPYTQMTVVTTPTRNGGNAFRQAGLGHWARRRIPTAEQHATITIGSAVQFNGQGHRWIYQFRGDGGSIVHVALRWENPTLIVYRGLASSVLATTSYTFNANQWYYVEMKVVLHDTAGSAEVRVNGVTLLNPTNVDTKNAGLNAVFDGIDINGADGNGQETYYDDFYMTNGAGSTNTGFLGDIAVETLYPDGNGSSSQFTGSDGNSTDNYLLVDEASPSTADYVQNGTNGQRDLYTYQALTRSTGTIYGVQAAAHAQKADSGDRSLKNVAKSGSTAGSSVALTLATTWEAKTSVFETNPDTSAAWTVSEVNGAEFGIETSA